MINISEKEFQALTKYIKENYGIHLKKEKQTFVTGRLHNLLTQLGFNNFSDYYNYLIKDKTGEASIVLVDKITTNHTYFMREADHFYFFRDQVLPYLKSASKEKDLRIWCAASSSGEEPYTLAMILDEFFNREKLWWDTKVLATDISTSILETAQKGVYSKDRIQPLPTHWKINYFDKYDNDNFIINDKIKSEVIYRKFNLMENIFPFRKNFHVIFCRNVMIYFDTETKDKLINKFYDIMEPGGYLFIGHSESLNREKTKFKYICPAVYRKI
jgi:chemotaxis protein methyltransferase CheR